jgi:hypothetical protein
MSRQEVSAAALKDILRFVIETAPIKNLPFCIWGSHGIGKTQIVGQVAEEMKYNLVVLHLSTQDITDLIGIPFSHKGDNGEYVMAWSVPKWLHDANQNYIKTGIPNLFFLDEMNRGHAIVLKAMLPFLLDGTLHLNKIGPKDCVVAACNPSTDEYEVNDMSDKALLDRMGHVIFSPSNKEYLDYCKSNGMDHSTQQVLKKNTKFVSIPKVEHAIEIKPSRRAIYNVMSIVGKKDPRWIRNRAGPVIECYLGEDFKNEWIAEFVKNDDGLDIDFIKNIAENRELILQRITKTIDGLETCAIDVVEKITDNINLYIKDKGKELDKEDVQWIIAFYSLPIISEEISGKVFLKNKQLNYAIARDKVINKMVGEFLSARKIVAEVVKSW